MLVAVALFTACGNKDNNGIVQNVNVQTDRDNNPVSQRVFFNEQETYQFKLDEDDKESVEIELSFWNPDLVSNYEEFVTSDNFYLLMLDKEGKSLVDENGEKLKFDYLSCPEGNNFTIMFFHNFNSESEARKFLKNVHGFTIYMHFGESDTISESSSTDIQSSNNSATNWDALLDDYEALVNEYDKFLTEMKSGNVDSQSAMNAASKAQAMQEKLDAGKSEMNSKQIQRLGKIATKLANIAAKAAAINPDDIKSVNGVNLEDLGL